MLICLLGATACVGTVYEERPGSTSPTPQQPGHPEMRLASPDKEIWGGPVPAPTPRPSVDDLRTRFRLTYLTVAARADALIFARVTEKRFEVQTRMVRGRSKRAPMTVGAFEVVRIARSQVRVPDTFELTFEEGSHSLMVQPDQVYLLAIRQTDTGFEPVLDRDYSAVPLAQIEAVLNFSADQVAQELSLAELRARP
jgi:hypothetical protein